MRMLRESGRISNTKLVLRLVLALPEDMTARDATKSIQSLLDSLQTLSPRLEGRKDDLQFLQSLVASNEFHSLIQVHHEVSAATSSLSDPVCTNALTVCHSLAYDIETSSHPETQELYDLLTSPHIDSLVSTHDRVANKEYPIVHSAAIVTSTMSIIDDSIKIVRFNKQQEPLGATVKCGKNGKVLISRVLHGGAADKSGLLHAGDVVHEINGTAIRGFSVDQVADLMSQLRGEVVFKITPAISDLRPKRRTQPPLYMRAYFEYDPKDHQTPCPEAGLEFEEGAILQIVNQDDPNWWQAVQYNDKPIQAGLIPSRTKKEKLLCMEQMNEQHMSKKKGKNKKSTKYSSFESEGFGTAVVTYEEVVKIEPQLERPRPIMIVAPRGGPFDMETLRARIVQTNPEKFGSPVPHTSRPARAGEEEKRQYVFVSRQLMERDIQNNQFVEHGLFDGHYYGTSINSIRTIINSSKTCILALIPQAIKLVRTGELKPFVVYCRAPTIEDMKKFWVPTGQIKETHISDIVRQAAFLEQTYGHYFDHNIPFQDIDTAVEEVTRIVDRLGHEQQWIPASWLETS